MENPEDEGRIGNAKFQSQRFVVFKNIINHQSPKVKGLLGPNLKRESGKSLGNMRHMSARKPIIYVDLMKYGIFHGQNRGSNIALFLPRRWGATYDDRNNVLNWELDDESKWVEITRWVLIMLSEKENL